MTTKTRGLGRNLSALLGNTSTQLLSTVHAPVTDSLKLSLECLQPGKFQPRAEMDDQRLEELASSIRQQGVLQPLIVREISDGQYEIIAGERRWRAAHLAGLTEIPVSLRQVDDETAIAMALVENLQREDLNPMDQARAMHRLTSEFGLTHQQVADVLSKSRTSVTNHLRLLSLHATVKQLLEHGNLDMGHARALLGLEDTQQTELAKQIVAKSLSVRETEKLVTRLKTKQPTVSKRESSPWIEEQLQHLSKHLNAKIHLKQSKAGKGSLVIQYDTLQRLETVIHELLLKMATNPPNR